MKTATNFWAVSSKLTGLLQGCGGGGAGPAVDSPIVPAAPLPVQATSYANFKASLNHDLGDDARGTGYDVALWIEEAVVTRGFIPLKITVHSANPSARQKVALGLQAIIQHARENAERGMSPSGDADDTAL